MFSIIIIIMCVYMYVYIYIYICIHLSLSIYIYIYIRATHGNAWHPIASNRPFLSIHFSQIPTHGSFLIGHVSNWTQF